jgi:hypothetical protein
VIELSEREIQTLVHEVAGSTVSIDSAIEDLGYPAYSVGLHTRTEIDSRVFECISCGWTYWRDEESTTELVCLYCCSPY